MQLQKHKIVNFLVEFCYKDTCMHEGRLWYFVTYCFSLNILKCGKSDPFKMAHILKAVFFFYKLIKVTYKTVMWFDVSNEEHLGGKHTVQYASIYFLNTN